MKALMQYQKVWAGGKGVKMVWNEDALVNAYLNEVLSHAITASFQYLLSGGQLVWCGGRRGEYPSHDKSGHFD